MKIVIKRFDASLPLPKQKTDGAVGFDVCSRLDLTIAPQSIAYIPLNIAVKVPEGYWVMLVARSSLHKHGLWLANGIGVIDSDYSGNEDEYIAPVYNFTDTPVKITKGDRVAQIIIRKSVDVTIEEAASLEAPSRGAFGTTGKQ